MILQKAPTVASQIRHPQQIRFHVLIVPIKANIISNSRRALPNKLNLSSLFPRETETEHMHASHPATLTIPSERDIEGA